MDEKREIIKDHDRKSELSSALNTSGLQNGSKGTSTITPVLVLCIIAVTLGSSSQFGFNTGVINSVQTVIRQSLNGSSNVSFLNYESSRSFNNLEWAATVSIFSIGGMFGALPSGAMSDCIGRKWLMLINNGIVVIGLALQCLAINPYMLIAGRFVIGVNAGINTVVAPLYISEIAPVKYRGAMGIFVQVSITSTILLSQVLGINVLLGRPDSDHYGWRILLAIPIVFVILQVLILPWCPESPRFLLIRRRKQDKAEKALKRLCGHGNVQSELRAMEAEFQATQNTKSLVVTEFVTNPVLRRALIVSIGLHLSQQITGIGSLLYYSTQIFKTAGVQNSDVATSVLGAVLVIGTLITVFLIDRVGRRTLMLYGLGGMMIFFALVSSAFCFQYAFYTNDTSHTTAPGILLVLFTCGVILSFSIGPGGIPWLMVSELFQQEARSFAVSIATIVNWLSNFAVSFLFPFMLDHLKPYPFIILMAVCALIWIFMYIYLPETKGKTTDEITDALKDSIGQHRHNCPEVFALDSKDLVIQKENL